MDSIKDILSSLKERFTSPLVFSFICAWMIINWQVVIALIWFDSLRFQELNHEQIFEFISKRVTYSSGIWIPLKAAVIYTLAAPILRNFIKIFYSWCYKWGEIFNLEIIGEGMISAKKYIRFRQDYDKRTKTLINLINTEDRRTELYESQKSELLELKNELSLEKLKNQEHQAFMSDLRNVGLLDGRWKKTISFENGGNGEETVTINGGRYIIDGMFGKPEHKFDIKNLFYDKRNKDLIFVKVVTPDFQGLGRRSDYIQINSLKLMTSNKLVGTENGTTKIEYTRID